MPPVGWTAQKRDPLAGHFVDDYEAGIVASTFAGGDGGGGYAEGDGEDDSRNQRENESAGGGVNGLGEKRP